LCAAQFVGRAASLPSVARVGLCAPSPSRFASLALRWFRYYPSRKKTELFARKFNFVKLLFSYSFIFTFIWDTIFKSTFYRFSKYYPIMEGKKFTTPLADNYVKNGIVYATFLPGEVTVARAQAHINIVKEELKDMAPFLVLIDISKSDKSANNKDVREILSDQELNEMTIATALVADSVFIRMAGNLFIRFTKRANPMSFFSNEADAIKWLEQYK
jgi:hypothetical protein